MVNKYKFRATKIRILFYLILFLGIFLYTAFNLRHIWIFSSVFRNYFGAFKLASIILYFITLDFLLAYYVLLFFYTLFKGEEGYNRICWLDKKLNIFEFIFKCFAILLFIMFYIVTPCSVTGVSMENTFKDSDNILTLNVYWELNDGDVIVFNASNYTNDHSLYIKRIIAKKGDHVEYIQQTGQLLVNGHLVKEVNNPEADQILSLSEYMTIRLSFTYNLSDLRKLNIPEQERIELNTKMFNNFANPYSFNITNDKYIIMGDNRTNSKDSRSFGAINQIDIYGKVFLRFYPFSEFKLFW